MQGYNPLMTPTPGMPQMAGPYWQKDLYDRNKPLTDEELDALIPASGYEIVNPPDGYVPITPSRKLNETPVVMQTPQGYMIPEAMGKPYDVQATPGGGD